MRHIHCWPQFITPDRTKLVVATADSMQSNPNHKDDEGKYARRTHPLKRMLQRLLPSLFAPSLPVTTKWVWTCGGNNEAYMWQLEQGSTRVKLTRAASVRSSGCDAATWPACVQHCTLIMKEVWISQVVLFT